jgi:hypothetical protein
MDAKFSKIGLPEDKVIEECAEVIQAITKIKRFGLYNHHPDRPTATNIDEVLMEINDLEYALDVYRDELIETQNMVSTIHNGLARLGTKG